MGRIRMMKYVWLASPGTVLVDRWQVARGVAVSTPLRACHPSTVLYLGWPHCALNIELCCRLPRVATKTKTIAYCVAGRGANCVYLFRSHFLCSCCEVCCNVMCDARALICNANTIATAPCEIVCHDSCCVPFGVWRMPPRPYV